MPQIYSPKWINSISQLDLQDWKYIVGNNVIPFYNWHWLHNLENSKSIIPSNGWQPLHLLIVKNNKPVAFAPLYLKGHSYGEFIYDSQFAELSNNLNLNYYPKLIGMSPVSPIEGYKFFIAKEENKEEITKLIFKTIDEFCLKNNILSCSFLYVDAAWRNFVESFNCAVWINQSSLCNLQGAQNFSDYLSKFNSNQRKNIKKERKSIKESGINIKSIELNEININNMEIMHDFYQLHCSRWGAWGSKYLTKQFFKKLSLEKEKQFILFSASKQDMSAPIAMSLCVKNQEFLWGRYWGSLEAIKFLHFELCYYSPISWAISNKIKFFDPGAGGNQKRRRGFIATPNYSLYRWYEPEINKIIRPWFSKVNKIILEEIKTTNNEVPFRV